MERCCDFMHRFKKIRWNKTALILCLLPFVLGMMVLIIILVCTVDSLGAVVSNSRSCAQVGANILETGGSAVDAAIATMLCEGISLPNNAGIGGGFSAIMSIDGRLDSIVATPTFPNAVADENFPSPGELKGAQTAGIPGELMGYWEMHQKYGMLSWKQIIEPSIRLCQEGIPITEWLAGVLRHNSYKLGDTPSMKEIFPRWQSAYYEQDFRIKFPTLAKTLRKIADHGVSVFYEGDIGKAFVEDIQENGGFITVEDLKKYKVLWNAELPKLRMLQQYKVITTPPPTSGAVIVLILNIIKHLKPDIPQTLFWHYVVEAMKHSFGMSLKLGDAVNDPEYADIIMGAYKNMSSVDYAQEIRQKIKPEKVLQDSEYVGLKVEDILGKGSANICILAPNGDIVAGTSSLLDNFGAFFSSNKTGIIVNNIFKRYFGAKNQPNRPLPNKHILSSFNPVIILDTLNKPYFIVGASGGSRGISLIVNAIIKYVMFETDAYDAVNSDLFYPDILPNKIEFGEEASRNVVKYLAKVGNKLVRRRFTYNNFTAATCIGQRNRRPTPQFTSRVGGSTAFVKPKHELGIIVVAIVAVLCFSVFGLMLYEVLHPRKTTLFATS